MLNNNFFKYAKLIVFCTIVLFLLDVSCKNKNSSLAAKKRDKASLDSSCLKNIINFADSLDLHKVVYLEDALETNNNFLDQCDFKLYRANPNFKVAIVQLGLKLNLHFLERGQHDVDMSFMFYASKRCKKIIQEIAFYAFQRETDYPEFMGTTLVYWIIAKEPYLKDNPRIKPLFANCMKLESKKIIVREFGIKKGNKKVWSPTSSVKRAD